MSERCCKCHLIAYLLKDAHASKCTCVLFISLCVLLIIIQFCLLTATEQLFNILLACHDEGTFRCSRTCGCTQHIMRTRPLLVLRFVRSSAAMKQGFESGQLEEHQRAASKLATLMIVTNTARELPAAPLPAHNERWQSAQLKQNALKS